jgi:hypothetical protein
VEKTLEINEIEILLEVSARLSDPDMFNQGAYNNEAETKFCTLGHLERVLLTHYDNDYRAFDWACNYAMILDEYAKRMFPACPLNQGANFFPDVCIASVNDFMGRKEAKAIIDARIRDLKDGLDGH